MGSFIKILLVLFLVRGSITACCQTQNSIVKSRDKNNYLIKTERTDTIFYHNKTIRSIVEYSLVKTLSGKLQDSTIIQQRAWDVNGTYLGCYRYVNLRGKQCMYTCGSNLVTDGDFESYSDFVFTSSGSKDKPDLNNNSIDKKKHCGSFLPDSFKAISGNSFFKLVLGAAYFPGLIMSYMCNLDPLIENKLALPVVKGQKYSLEFWVRRNPFSKFNYGKLNVYIRNCPLARPVRNLSCIPLYVERKSDKSQVIFQKSFKEFSSKGWEKISIVFKAKRDGEYLVIGCLDPTIVLSEKKLNQEDLAALNYHKKENYKVVINHEVNPNMPEYVDMAIDSVNNYSFDYRFLSMIFIDNVSLKALECAEQEKDTPMPGLPNKIDTVRKYTITTSETFDDTIRIVPQTSYILHNVLFYFNSSEIQTASFPELNVLYGILQRDSLFSVEISGHTDNTGNEAYNYTLSVERAKSVVEYLINKGINPNRFTYKGYGSSMPIEDNKTDKGKASNRRVEFKLISK